MYKKKYPSSPRLHLFDQKYSKTVILWNINTILFLFNLNIFSNVIYKAVFSASLLQSSVSHDPSEIVLILC